jgi:hypothetical protein
MYGGLFFFLCLYKCQDPPSASPIFLFSARRSLNTLMLKEKTYISDIFSGERDIGGSMQTAGVEVGGGHTGGNTTARGSLAVDQPCGTRASPWGEAKRYTSQRMVAAGGTARLGGVLELPKTCFIMTLCTRDNCVEPTFCYGPPRRAHERFLKHSKARVTKLLEYNLYL